MPVIRHIHKYYRRENGLWHCGSDEGCTHYFPRNMGEPFGQKSKCWGCDGVIQLNGANMTDGQPRCVSCALEFARGLQYVRDQEEQARAHDPYIAFRTKPKPEIGFGDDVPTSEGPDIVNSEERKAILKQTLERDMLELHGPDWRNKIGYTEDND